MSKNAVIPSKHLGTNLNRLSAGPSVLLRAKNIRVENGEIRERTGQDFLPTGDKALLYLGNTHADGYVPIKAWWYNNRPWCYFRNVSDDKDAVGYYDFDSAKWYVTLNWAANFNADYLHYLPQVVESDRRLLVATKWGLYESPKLETDVPFGSNLDTYQTRMRHAGVPKAVHPHIALLIDTTATYAQNWMAPLTQVAYRIVWKKIDENGIVSYGAPSGRIVLKNSSSMNSYAVQVGYFIPYEIRTASTTDRVRYISEIHRTRQTVQAANGVYADPGDEMLQVLEVKPTAADFSAGYISVFDIVGDAALQDPLYTDESQEGILSGREQPPICKTLARWGRCTWFGNTTERWRTRLDVLGVEDSGAGASYKTGLRPNDVVIVGDWALEAVTGVPAAYQFSLDNTSGLAAQIGRVTNTARSIALYYNLNSTRKYEMHYVSGPDDFTGKLLLEEALQGQVSDVPYIGLYRKNGWSYPSPLSPAPLISSSKGIGFLVTQLACAGAGQAITITCDSAVDFIVGDTVNFAQISTGPTDIPSGQYVVNYVSGADIKLTGITGSGAFTRTAGAGAWTGFNLLGALHCVRDSVTGNESLARGNQEIRPNRVFFSPPLEPEAAPLVNYFDVGAADKAILAMREMGSSLFIFKADGLYQTTGSYPQFYVELVDQNMILVGPDCVAQMGGDLYAWTTRGVYRIGPTGSERISGDVQNLFDVCIQKNFANARLNSFAVGHEDDHSVTFWIPVDGATKPNLGLVFDGEGWTQRTDQANHACYGTRTDADDQSHLYTVKNHGGSWLTRSRKTFSAMDRADERLILTMGELTIDSATQVRLTRASRNQYPVLDSKIALLFVGGCMVNNNNLATRANILACSVSGAYLQFTLSFPGGGSTADWVTAGPTALHLYAGYKAEAQWGIQDADDPSTRKHFSEIGILFRQPYFTACDIGFSSDIEPSETFQTSDTDPAAVPTIRGPIAGTATVLAPDSWPILQEDTTLADKMIRTPVSTKYARCSQLRVSLRHNRCFEFWSIYGYVISSSAGGRQIERTP